MVIDEINVVHVTSFKPKGDPPVASNRNAPKSSSVPPEWMQSVSRQVEIARFVGGIQVRQGESDSVQLVCCYPAGVVSLIEPSQPSMAKRTNHGLIIPCTGTAINGFANPVAVQSLWDVCPQSSAGVALIRFAEWRKAVKNEYENRGKTACASCAAAQFRSITLIRGAKSWFLAF